MAEVEKMRAGEKTGGESFFSQEREERNQVPRGGFYRGSTPRPRRQQKTKRAERATVAHSPPGEKFEAPTPSDSRARRTRALISQAKRPIQPGRDGTAVSSPHAPRLKRSALKSYVRTVPSRQVTLDPLLTKVAERSPSGTDSVSPDPVLTPSQNRKAVLVRREFRLARPRYYKQI